MTSSLLWTSSAVPSAIFSPWSRTMTLSARSLTTLSLCSMSRMLNPISARLRNWVASSIVSAGFIPAVGSSSNRSFGREATARAISAHGGRPQHGADGVGMGARMHADEDVLQHRHVGEQAEVLEGARDAMLHD